MNELGYFLIDVFTTRQFGGNPLAVFPQADGVATEVMQSIASELNLSETTFIQQAKSEGADCTVRIFTPRQEMPMAGHPTVGTAWTILNWNLLTPRHADHLVFDEGVGPVKVEYRLRDSQPTDLVMHQPLPEFFEVLDTAVVAEMLSLDVSDLHPDLPVQVVSNGVPMIIVPLASLDAARRSKVRLDLLESKLRHVECQELFVFTTETDFDADVHCRMFAPRLGVPEDPATGVAHGSLGGYLFKYKLFEQGWIVSEQGVEMGRPSTIRVHIEGTGDELTGMSVGGDCVAVGTGTMQVAMQ